MIDIASIKTPYLTTLNGIKFKLFCAAYKYVQIAMGSELLQLQADITMWAQTIQNHKCKHRERASRGTRAERQV